MTKNHINKCIMKKTALIITIILSVSYSFGQKTTKEYNKLIKKAENNYYNKNYIESAKTYSEAFQENGGKGLREDYYNLACSWALANYKDSAFSNLYYIAKSMNYSNYFELSNDKDFISLHSDSLWSPLIEIVKANQLKTTVKKPRNIFKLQIADIINQEVRVDYEHSIAPNISIVLGCGFPYGMNNFEKEKLHLLFDIYSESYSLFNIYEASNHNYGNLFFGSLKLYFKDYKNKDIFVDFAYKNTSNNYTFLYKSIYNGNQYYDYNVNNQFFTISLGSLHLFKIGKYKFLHEYSIGFGFQLNKWDKYNNFYKYDFNTGQTIDYFYKSNIERNSNTTITLSYNIGLGWGY